MGLRINHNTSAINSHRNLQANDLQLSKSLEKLSSGLKINRAADGPASLVISEQMRAQVAGLNQAIQNTETSVSMVQTTEAALNEVNKLLVSMRQLAIHAANEGVNDDVMLAADQQELQNSISTIDRISQTTQFGTKKLLDGSNGANGATTGEGLQFVRAETTTKASTEDGYDVVITTNASKATVQGTEVFTDEMAKGGETLMIMEGGKTASYTTNGLDNAQTAVQNLQAAIRKVGLNVEVNINDDGTLGVTHTKYGSEAEFQVSSTTAGVLSEVGGEFVQSTAGTDIAGTINGESAVGEGQILTGIRGAKNIDGLSIRYTGQAGDGGDLPEEGVRVGAAHVTQQSLTFQVGANRNQTVGISLLNTASDSLSKGVENDSGFGNIRELDLTSAQGAQDSLLLIDNAINEISSTRADLGAFQKNTLESNLSNLNIARENLVASESSIRDADMAAEMADYTKNQIMTKSATAMLAQANQMPANVLQLLG